MCVIKVYSIVCLFFIGSLVHAYINNEEPTPYKQKASYINHRLNHRNSYQYLSHRLRHNNRYFNNNNLNNNKNNNNNYNIEVKTENPFRRLYATTTTTTEKQIVNVHHQDMDVFDETDGKPDDTIKNYEAEDDDEEEDEDDDDEEEDYDASEAEDWQAEEATEEPTERTITEYKWKHFGTRSRVEESRKNANTLPAGVHQAVAHARKVVQQGACHTPRIRLIKIQSVYPDAGKAYIPHCTLLHRCSDETGCCRTDSLTCAPKTTERIELYFYTGRPNNYKVEKLAFYNHTECHCIEKSAQEVMSGDAALQQEDRHPIRPAVETPAQHSSTSTQVTLAEPLKKCHCPELYTPQITHKTCRCDCLEGNRDCMRIKRGKEYFSLKDRLCIQRQECGNPSCEFGVYIRFAGRCPRKQESITKISTQ